MSYDRKDSRQVIEAGFRLMFLTTLGASLWVCAGCSAPRARARPPSKETVTYGWLNLTVGSDGEHVYRAEIDCDLVRRRDELNVEVKAADLWINVMSASKESVLLKLGKNARHELIEDGRTQELYQGADNEVIFLGGSFAFQGDNLRMVALLANFALGAREER
jgi:hypothetical protein